MGIPKYYDFKSARDMVELAKVIQSKVYWGRDFLVDYEDQDIALNYILFWDYASIVIEEKNAIGVTIDESDEVTFVYNRKDFIQ